MTTTASHSAIGSGAMAVTASGISGTGTAALWQPLPLVPLSGSATALPVPVAVPQTEGDRLTVAAGGAAHCRTASLPLAVCSLAVWHCRLESALAPALALAECQSGRVPEWQAALPVTRYRLRETAVLINGDEVE